MYVSLTGNMNQWHLYQIYLKCSITSNKILTWWSALICSRPWKSQIKYNLKWKVNCNLLVKYCKLIFRIWQYQWLYATPPLSHWLHVLHEPNKNGNQDKNKFTTHDSAMFVWKKVKVELTDCFLCSISSAIEFSSRSLSSWSLRCCSNNVSMISLWCLLNPIFPRFDSLKECSTCEWVLLDKMAVTGNDFEPA